ncbi:HET-domain-containing protein [Xylariaceae sp. AK1471]|nr:HET-domain-containing protein [Xylariaceae sp. AK1471]
MRLLNTKTLKLESFLGSVKPAYAILSHTWGDNEILFKDVQHESTASWKQKAGGAKVLGVAEIARAMRYSYLWVDSCCIDKASSAELSEAINSMYKWYEESAICFAYLSDVRRETSADDARYRWFEQSRWFERGWTLQELIAPPNVQFYDVNWVYLGSRRNLVDIIARITRISRSALLKEVNVLEQSVSCKMSWAVGRATTRTEDMAYSLMGIFDINMPLLYGEGNKAFRRLQEEIIRHSNDHTILLSSDSLNHWAGRLNLLADTESWFSTGQQFTRYVGPPSSQFQIQGNTLHGTLLLAAVKPGYVLGILDGSYADDPTSLSRPALLLEESDGLYARADNDIMRVTLADGYTASVRSYSRNRMDLETSGYPFTGLNNN